jgi:hypothetical protein
MSRRSAVRARLSAIRFFGSSHSLVGPGQLTLNQQTSVRIRVGTKKKQVGAVEACRAHNPKVPRSKLGLANLDFFIALLAQLAERTAFNRVAEGSSPSQGN